MDNATSCSVMQDKSPFAETGMVIDALAMVAGLGLLAVSTTVLLRLRGTRRRPWGALFSGQIHASFCILAMHAYRVAQYALLYNDRPVLAHACAVGAEVLARLVDNFALVLVTTFCTDRVNTLRRHGVATDALKWERTSVMLMGFVYVLLFGQVSTFLAYEGVLLLRMDDPPTGSALSRYMVHAPTLVSLMRFSTRVYAVGVTLATIYIVRQRRAAVRDKVLDTAVLVVVPLLVAHAAFRVALSVWSTESDFAGSLIPDPITDNAVATVSLCHIMRLVATLDSAVFPVLALSVIVWLSSSPSDCGAESIEINHRGTEDGFEHDSKSSITVQAL